MSVEQLNEIYTVLVDVCGASEHERFRFMQTNRERNPHEWRFIGLLGFGGKLWTVNGRAPYVNCYPEDKGPEEEKIIAEANRRLAKFTYHQNS